MRRWSPVSRAGLGRLSEAGETRAKQGVALCPTLATAEAYGKYGAGGRRWIRSLRSLKSLRVTFKKALDVGVTIVNGSDMGVFAHGLGARELELLVTYGMRPAEALRSATSIAAKVLHLNDRLGAVKAGLLAELIAVEEDPTRDIGTLRKVQLVIKGGEIYREP